MSAEIEYEDVWSMRLGEEGNGVATIIEMVQHTRLDAAVVPAGMMRQALVQAIHHARHRKSFGKPLAMHPLMPASSMPVRMANGRRLRRAGACMDFP